jgi:uncharacterized membrane protein YhhN
MLSKPLIVLSLFIYFLQASGASGRIATAIKAALLFSLAGDLFLLFEARHEIFFMAGLGSFLVAHLFYISAFHGIRKLQRPASAQWPWAIGVIVYGSVLMYMLEPYLGELKIPVAAYALVLCIMLLSAARAFRKPYSRPGIICLAGALLFVLSDSILAINKFYMGFAFAGMAVMFTYGCAQYLLVTGVSRLLHSVQTAKFDPHSAT